MPKWHPPLGTWTWLEKLDPEAVEVDADALTSDIARAFHHKLDAKSIEPEALAAALEKYGVVDRTVVYGGLQFLARLKEIRPSIRRMPPLGDLQALGAIARSIEPYAFDVRWEILSPDLIRRCHELGIMVFSDALGRHEKVEDYLQAMRWGVDLIQTDHSVRLIRAAEIQSRRVPPQ